MSGSACRKERKGERRSKEGEADKKKKQQNKQKEQNKQKKKTREKRERSRQGHTYNISGCEPGTQSIRCRQVQQEGILGAAYRWLARAGNRM